MDEQLSPNVEGFLGAQASGTDVAISINTGLGAASAEGPFSYKTTAAAGPIGQVWPCVLSAIRRFGNGECVGCSAVPGAPHGDCCPELRDETARERSEPLSREILSSKNPQQLEAAQWRELAERSQDDIATLRVELSELEYHYKSKTKGYNEVVGALDTANQSIRALEAELTGYRALGLPPRTASPKNPMYRGYK